MKYKIRACDRLGAYKFRIIIPVISYGLVVQFTAMGIADQDLRYKHCPNEKALADIKSCLYNIDTVEDTAVVVEGVTDVWRMGDSCVCTFGTTFTDAQVNLLSKRAQRIFVMFDSARKDKLAPYRAEQLADQLSTLVPHVEVIYLKKGDPADMSDDEVLNLRKEIELDGA
jgi:DNA primase